MTKVLEKLQQAFGEQLKLEVNLAEQTTWKIGGPAQFFLTADNNEEAVKAIKLAVDLKVPYLILGGGSNLLVSDQGFRGLVIKLLNNKVKITREKVGAVIYAEAGLPLARLVGEAAGGSLTGLEWATGIPGTVGGAVRGNAGAFGHELAELVRTVKYLRQGKEKTFKNKDCQFAYRSSIFKGNNELVVLAAEFFLKASQQAEIVQATKQTISLRKKGYPPSPNAGCVFKNIIVDETTKAKLVLLIPELDKYLKGGKLPAGLLIQECGLKGKTVGQAQVWPEHANYILNLGGATAEQVITLVSLVKQQVRDRFGIQLQEEIEQVGF
ncbi:MAG: UDP-N-acetylmuramate dehydrogenase [Candidatus Buchananbacteria bacterium]